MRGGAAGSEYGASSAGRRAGGFAMVRCPNVEGDCASTPEYIDGPLWVFGLLLDPVSSGLSADSCESFYCTCCATPPRQPLLSATTTGSASIAPPPGPSIGFIATQNWRVCWRCVIRVSETVALPPPFSSSFTETLGRSFPVRVHVEKSCTGRPPASTWKQLLQELFRTLQLQGEVKVRSAGGSSGGVLQLVFPLLSCVVDLTPMRCSHTVGLLQQTSLMLSEAYYFQLFSVSSATLPPLPNHSTANDAGGGGSLCSGGPGAELRVEDGPRTTAGETPPGLTVDGAPGNTAPAAGRPTRDLVHPHQRVGGQKRTRGLTFGSARK